MVEIFKSYGAAIGPTLAFILGILALFVKYRLDEFFAKKNLNRELDKLYSLLRNAEPPPEYFPKKSREFN